MKNELISIRTGSKTIEQSITFTLDKPHYQECFEQSALPVQFKDYFKSILFAVIGISLFFVEAEHYFFAFFIFCLAIVELLSVKYRKNWWVWRQLMSKAANGSVELLINDSGIKTTSRYINAFLPWEEVLKVKQTEKGLLLKHKGGTNYLSKEYLGDQLSDFILTKNAD